MRSLARKITKAKWEPATGLAEHEIAADAVTACLRTVGNGLSFWHCELEADELPLWQAETSDGEISDVVLALASSMERLSRIDLVFLPRSELEAAGLAIHSTPQEGATPVDDIRFRHVDLIALDLVRLSLMAHRIALQVRSERFFRRFREREVAEVLRRAIDADRLDPNGLQPELRDKIFRV